MKKTIVSMLLFTPALCWAQGYTITTAAGGGPCLSDTEVGDGGPATSACVNGPFDVAVDAAGNLYIAAGTVRKVARNGIITTVAGGGQGPGIGDGGPATRAVLSATAVAVDSAGNLYIADTPAGRSRVRKVDAQGTITTVAGNDRLGFSGDGGPATSAQLFPQGLAADSAGNLYIADRGNSRIRKVAPDGIITTVAGGGSPASGIGDGGPAINATLFGPYGVAVDPAGNLYISDVGNGRIRKVSTNGVITTVAGDGSSTYSGDGGPATKAGVESLWHVAVDATGNIYITERLTPFAQSSGNFVQGGA